MVPIFLLSPVFLAVAQFSHSQTAIFFQPFTVFGVRPAGPWGAARGRGAVFFSRTWAALPCRPRLALGGGSSPKPDRDSRTPTPVVRRSGARLWWAGSLLCGAWAVCAPPPLSVSRTSQPGRWTGDASPRGRSPSPCTFAAPVLWRRLRE